MIRTLTPAEVAARAAEFAALNVAVVEAGGPILFIDGVTHERAEAYWKKSATADDGKVVVVAEDETGRLIGTASVAPYFQEMVRHRAEIVRVMVHPDARGRGVGEALMRGIDEAARGIGCTVLHLFAHHGGGGARLYERCGWELVGTIPDEMTLTDGTFVTGAVYWKRVG